MFEFRFSSAACRSFAPVHAFALVALCATVGSAQEMQISAERRVVDSEVVAAPNSVDDDLTCDGAGGNACVVFRCAGGGCVQSIPDNDSRFATFNVTAQDLASLGLQNCTLNDVNAAVDLIHGDVGDLHVELSKDATARTLYDPSSACNATAFDGVFTDESATGPNACPFNGVSLRPDDSLSAFDGINPVGSWTFEIRDSESGDSGTLRDLGLAFRATCQGIGGACIPDADTLCLNGGRFRVEATYDTTVGLAGKAQAVKLTADTGYFWFFNSANVEAVVKVLNGCGLNSRYWVFAGGLTNVRTVITATDTQTGAVRTYTNPQSTPFQPIQDTSAFATCP